MKQLKIGNIAELEIRSGQIMNRINAQEDDTEPAVGTYKVIIPKCINNDGTITVRDLAEEKLRVLPDERRISRPGDIVMKLCTPYSAAMINEEDEAVGCVIPSFCAVIRCENDEVLPGYLLAFLNSENCKEQLKAQVAGAVMPILSILKIKEVSIPLPSMDRQSKIAADFFEAQKKMQVMRQILELTEKRNDVVFNNLVNEND